MRQKGSETDRSMGRRPRALTLLAAFTTMAALLATLGPQVAAQAQQASCGAGDPTTAQGNCSVTIDVRDFESGNPLTDFTFIINEDNAKLPTDPLALNSESFSPIVRTGDATRNTFTLPDGRYLVSARSLDHKLWGAYFTLPDDAANNALTVRVDLTEQSADHPLPLGRITTYVFEDNAWTNGAPDAEEAVENGGTGMEGFRVQLTEETEGAVTVDYFNDPLCGDGVCLTDSEGFNTIDNLGPAGYNITVFPPDHCNPNLNASNRLTTGPGHWYQTTTIDGGLSLQAPVEEGSDGSGAPGEQLWEPLTAERTGYFFGFVCAPLDFANPGTGEIVGQARNWVEWAPYTVGTFTDPVADPFIALTDAATDQTIFVGQGDGNGNFDIQNVPAGTYNMSIWDEQLSYIMRFKPVTVAAGQTVDVNETSDDPNGPDGVGVSRWFGWLDGHVYKDLNSNGEYDACAPGQNPGPNTCDPTLGNTDVDQRWRDGSIKEGTFTNPNGYYEYPTAEGGALGRWFVGEQGFARFSSFPGASVHDEHTGDVIPSCVATSPAPLCIPNSQGGGLLVNQLTLEGHRATVDWGKQDYPPGTPGQIVGITYFATTRNEFNAMNQAHEDYEPAIPDATVYLETPGPDGVPNTADDIVVNSYVTDHWAQPNENQDPVDPGNPAFSQSCNPIRAFDGSDITNQFNPKIGPNCLEVPLAGAQTKEGAFDGGYAFADYCPNGYDLAADNGTCIGGGDPAPLVAGDYIVHSIMPKDPTDTRDCNPAGESQRVTLSHGTIPGGGQGCIFHIVREEDVNVDLGNQFASQIPPPPCNGDAHILDQSTLVSRSKPYFTGDQSLRSDTVDTTAGSATVVDPTAVAGDVGKFVSGPGIPSGAKIVSVNPGVSFTMNVPATATATGVSIQISGSPWAPLCDKHLVVLKNGQNANADFFLMTDFRTDPNGEDPGDTRTGDVAEPARFVGQVFNDIYFERNPESPWFGEPRPIGGIPVGIYARVDVKEGAGYGCPADSTGNANGNRTCITGQEGGTGPFITYNADRWRLLTTVKTSPDGSFEALVPSTETFNCPIPQGPCPGMYLVTVDDPGTKDHPNPGYDPNLLTATTPASAWPGQTNPTLDLPLDPISGTACDFSLGGDGDASTVPELLQVSTPVVPTSGSRQITIQGDFIGPAGPTGITGGHINLTDVRTGAVTNLTRANGGVVSWTPGDLNVPDTIVINVPAVSSSFPPGPKQLTIVGATSNGGNSSVNGITMHVLGTNGGVTYNPPIVNVPPPPPVGVNAHALQDEIDGAAAGSLLVLSPGVYNENVLMWKPVKIQGLGPGGIIGAHELGQRAPEDPRFNVKGSVLDGRFFPENAATYDATVAAHVPYATDPTFTDILRGADITVVAKTSAAYDASALPTGQDSAGFGGARIDGLGLQTGHGLTGISGQGGGAGGIQLQANINDMQLTNNILENNSGVFAGGIGLGQPYAHGSHNYNVRIANDRVLGNGGLMFAGGLGIFYGSNNYEVARSIFCSNFSVEYGGGISHFGLSPGGSIHDDQIYYNDAVDSGGGIALQTEGASASSLGDGSGAVNLDRNLIQSNYSGDDGGGIFVANALDQPINVRNDMIVDNGAADIGGAILLDDASNVRIINDTVANNVTTGSSENSFIGLPHAAGLASEANEPLWQAAQDAPRTDTVTINGGSTTIVDPAITAADVNKNVTGTRIPAGSIILSVNLSGAPATHSFQMSRPVTGTSTQNNVPLTIAPAAFSNPRALFNDIFWNNDAFTLSQFGPGAALVDNGFIDFEVHGTSNNGDTFTPRYSDLTNGLILGPDGNLRPVPPGQGNTSGDPGFVDPFILELTVSGSRGDPQQAAVTITGQDPPVGLVGDYHLTLPAAAGRLASAVIDRGAGYSNLLFPAPNIQTPTVTPSVGSILAPCSGTLAQLLAGTSSPADYDRQFRPYLWVTTVAARQRTPWDIGADELPSLLPLGIPKLTGVGQFVWNGAGQLQCSASTETR